MIAHYRKLAAALVGLAILMLHRQYGIDLMGTEPLWVELAISAGTALAVWYWPNEPEAKT